MWGLASLSGISAENVVRDTSGLAVPDNSVKRSRNL